MNNLRFDAPSQAWPTAGSDALSRLSLVAGSAGTDLKPLAAELVRLASQDPGAAHEVLRDVLSLTPPSASREFAATVATTFDDNALAGLAQDPVGRDIVALLERFGGIAARATIADAATNRAGNNGASNPTPTPDWSWAGLTAQIRPSLLSAVATTPRKPASGEAADAERVKSAFKEEFAAKAANKQEFDALMKQVYGDNYDKNLAEQYRQQALSGDFSFLPEVKFVDPATLQGGKGAYNEAEGVVYINRDIAASDPDLAAQVFVEEAGAHLDAKLNTTDTRGDEGEMFRRVMKGEQLSARELEAIRNDNDHGTITVDGKKVEVEFWFGEDLVDAASDVVDAVGEAVSDVGDAIKEVGMGVINAGEIFMKGLVVDVIGGCMLNLLNGRFSDAFDAVINGVDKMAFQTTKRLFNAAVKGVGHYFKAFTHVLPDKFGGKLAREVIDRAADVVHTVGNAVVDIARNTWRMPFEIYGGIAHDLGEVLKHVARGDFGGAFERLGMTVVNPFKRAAGTIVDNAMIVGQGIANVISAFNPDVPPPRGLSKDERAYLKSVYGDSINLEDIRVHRGNMSHGMGAPAAHTVGNDIYIPDNEEGKPVYWNPDGTLTQEGKLLLVHETFHVYQSQKGGNDYIHDALLAQMDGITSSGNRNAGYDFTKPLKEGKPFEEWNPEQQAEFIETMTRARDAKFKPVADLNGDGKKDASYDFNGNGKVDAFELNMAFYDQDGDGNTDQGKFVNRWLNDADMERANAIFKTLSDDRPDRTLVA